MQAGCPPLPCSPWRSHAHVCPQGYIRIVLEAAERDAASGCARGCDAFACEPDLGSALGFGPTVETVEPRPCGAFDDEPGRQTCRADADGCVGNWSLAVVDCGVPLPIDSAATTSRRLTHEAQKACSQGKAPRGTREAGNAGSGKLFRQIGHSSSSRHFTQPILLS